MVPLLFVKEQLEGFRRAIERVSESSFPYDGPEAAINTLSNHVDRLDTTIERAMHPHRDATTARQACEAAHHALQTYLPLLGFLLRSTNTRNAFEVCGPLQRLISRFLTGRRLILSSEWQFAPFTEDYQGFGNFVFIGFPASEAHNPLLLPLAAHELGHPVWRKRAQGFRAEIQSWLKDNPRASAGAPPEQDADRWIAEWAARKLEEAFCDCLAVRIFGESFLHAAAYMLASHPSQAGDNDIRYLKLKARIALVVRAAREYDVKVPADYTEQFEGDPCGDLFTPPSDPDVERAEQCALAFVNRMISEAESIAREAKPKYDLPSKKQVNEIKRAFELRVPPSNPASLAAILNAAWERYLKIHPDGTPASLLKNRILRYVDVARGNSANLFLSRLRFSNITNDAAIHDLEFTTNRTTPRKRCEASYERRWSRSDASRRIAHHQPCSRSRRTAQSAHCIGGFAVGHVVSQSEGD